MDFNNPQLSDLISWTQIIKTHCPECTDGQCLRAAVELLRQIEQPATRSYIADSFRRESKRFIDTINVGTILSLMDDQPEFEGWSDFGSFIARRTDEDELTVKAGSFVNDREYDIGVWIRIKHGPGRLDECTKKIG